MPDKTTPEAVSLLRVGNAEWLIHDRLEQPIRRTLDSDKPLVSELSPRLQFRKSRYARKIRTLTKHTVPTGRPADLLTISHVSDPKPALPPRCLLILFANRDRS